MAVSSVSARTLNIVTGSVTYALPDVQMGDAVNDGAGGIVIMGRTFPISEISRMYVDDSVVEDNTVWISYAGESASVTVAGNIARYVAVQVEGAHVGVTQSDEVSGNTCGEITYNLSGESSDGALSLSGSYKASLRLHGLRLANPSGAALDIQDGKRIAVILEEGTVNSLADGEDGSHKGALVCKGHLEFKGKGGLAVSGNTSHAVYAKEYVEMEDCSLTIDRAVKDGINCTQYFLLKSGSLEISGTGDDGIQTDFKDASDREAEDTGSITVMGGTLNVSVTAVAAKGLKAEGDVIVSGGEITAEVKGKGKWDSEKSKTKASSCISADGNCSISSGKLNLTATGSGGKGISCDGKLVIDGGDITVLTSGGIFAYVNGKEYDGYTGNTDRLDSDAKSSPKGMKADTEITINGGRISVTTTGCGGEGIESKGILTINDGDINVRSYDDAINSSSHMYIKGGDITVVATDNDGLDSNGNLYLMGGTVRAFGAGSPECGIDANEEEGYTVIFTGGTLLAVGGNNSVPSTSESTQPYVNGSASLSAGDEVILKDGDKVLASFTVPEDYKASSTGGGNFPGGGGFPGGGAGGGRVLVTCAGLTSGSSYTLTAGSSSGSVTAALQGSGNPGRPF